MKILNKIKEWFVSREDVSSKAYCECGNEVLQDPLSKVYEAGSTTNIICSKCGVQTNWDLEAPVPLFIKAIR